MIYMGLIFITFLKIDFILFSSRMGTRGVGVDLLKKTAATDQRELALNVVWRSGV